MDAQTPEIVPPPDAESQTLQRSPVDIVQAAVHRPELLHGLDEHARRPIVDYLKHGLGLTQENIARMVRVCRQTIVRDLRWLRKQRAKYEIDYIPARELAADLTADAETCYSQALKNGDPVGAYAIKLKHAEMLNKLGLVLDGDSAAEPITLAGLRRKLSDRLGRLHLPDGLAQTNGHAKPGPDPDPA